MTETPAPTSVVPPPKQGGGPPPPVFRRAAHVDIRRSDNTNEETYLVSNDAAGTVFLAERPVVDVLERMDGRAPVGAIAHDLGMDEGEMGRIVQLLLSGALIIVPGATQSMPTPPKPPEMRLIFFKLDLLDAGPFTRFVAPVLGALYSLPGVLAWCALIITAAVGLAAEPEAFTAAFEALANLSWESGVYIAIIFIVLKLCHELGHAVALHQFAQKEGVSIGEIRAGISFFAFFPFPFTDATLAWKLRSRMRRAAIGLGGMYFETWVAAAAAILWMNIRPGELQSILFQVLLISGASTLLFNLNPLVRLDGYYIYSDLAQRPNLATRGSMAARACGGWLLGGPKPHVDRFHLGYWVLSYLYRWVIFAGIFWAAFIIDPRLAGLIAVITVLALVLRPLWGVIKSLKGVPLSPLRMMLTVGGVAAIAALFAIPVPDTVHVEGRLVRYEHQVIRIEEAGRLVAAAAPTTTGGVVAEFSNPSLLAERDLLRQDQAQVESTLRLKGFADAALRPLLEADLQNLSERLSQVDGRIAGLTVAADARSVWNPVEAPIALEAWLAPAANRVLGTVSSLRAPQLFAVVDQRYSDFGEMLATGTGVEYRPITRPSCVSTASAAGFTSMLNEGEEAFALKADISGDDHCVAALPEGAGVMIRLARPDAPLAKQLFAEASRLALSRLPIDTAGR